nr:olfactory receptor 75 [Tropidothorax elegans]
MVDIFRFYRYALRLVGVTLPGDTKRKWLQVLADVYLTFNLLCGSVWGILLIRSVFLYPLDDFINRVIGVAAGISCIGAVTKYVIFRIKRDIFQSLMDDLNGFECSTPRGKIVMKVTRFYSFMVLMIIVTHNIHPLFEPFHRTTPYYVQNITGPFDEVLRDYVFGLYSATIILSGNVIGDVLFLIMASQICHKIYILANTFSAIGLEWDPEKKDVLEFPRRPNNHVILKRCIEEHNRLLILKGRLEELFRTIIAAQLFYSFSDTCFTLFAVSQCENIFEAIKELLPQFISLFLEIFLYCWGGEMIHTHFELLHKAVYDNGWYTSEPEVKSSILIVQIFTGIPVNITSLIFNFNFKFYETICRETFSYYTIMYQFFSQK